MFKLIKVLKLTSMLPFNQTFQLGSWLQELKVGSFKPYEYLDDFIMARDSPIMDKTEDLTPHPYEEMKKYRQPGSNKKSRLYSRITRHPSQ